MVMNIGTEQVLVLGKGLKSINRDYILMPTPFELTIAKVLVFFISVHWLYHIMTFVVIFSFLNKLDIFGS